MAQSEKKGREEQAISFDEFRKGVLRDYRIACESREASLTGRKEVLTGKAKFGIFGDGKEIPQLAMARAFRNGDFRSGYYRDQTFMFATDNLSLEQWFAGLYAHTEISADPTSSGRQMGGHFATRNLDENGSWKNLMEQKNSSADISPTGSQMPRLLGLAQASKVYRNHPAAGQFARFTDGGNEVAFGTIGDASTSEGLFWETINAAGVLQVPVVISVWDDGHGISVPKKYQTTKESISDVLAGFAKTDDRPGYLIYKVKGWDYAGCIETYEKAVELSRKNHQPVFIHVEELTQPQGHSTSGSHERYKSKERLEWEQEFDGIRKMRDWILSNAIATEDDLNAIESESKEKVKQARKNAWDAFLRPILRQRDEALTIFGDLLTEQPENAAGIIKEINRLKAESSPLFRDIHVSVRKVLRLINKNTLKGSSLLTWYKEAKADQTARFSDCLYSVSPQSPLLLGEVKPVYADESKLVDAREIIRDNFDHLLYHRPEVLIFGEDVGRIGDVNQGCEKLQEKHGELRVSDTGIREATIIGQGIGMAMRGLRPIAEIQYLDYFLYALQLVSDDLSTVQYRTRGGQKAPLIIRTRGHRLEGIWHSGSPMGMIVHAVRGTHVCVPRNMTKAAGFYNLLLKGDDPAVVVEPLNGYRLKEQLPLNLGEFTTPLGVPEIIREGTDITIVSYGSTLRLVLEAAAELADAGIECGVIDVQTLLPFDIHHSIAEHVKKSNRLLVVDEDVPGGASAYILQQIIEVQGAYRYLDASPRTLTAKDHRPAYGSDGDYFSKPSAEDIYDAVMMVVEE